jgi:hypothetical protein
MTSTNSEIVEQLKRASDGLLFMSESEYPFEVFLWEGIAPATPEKVVQQTHHSQDTPVEIVGVDDFFKVAWFCAMHSSINFLTETPILS